MNNGSAASYRQSLKRMLARGGPAGKDSEYMHLFSGPVDIEAHVSQVREHRPGGPGERHSVTELAARISQLEAEVAAINEKLGRDG